MREGGCEGDRVGVRGVRTGHRGHTDIVVSESDRVSVRWMQGHEIGVHYMNDGLTN